MKKISLFLTVCSCLIIGCSTGTSMEINSVSQVKTAIDTSGRIKIVVMINKPNGERVYPDVIMPADEVKLLVAKEHNLLNKVSATVWFYDDHINLERVFIRK